MKWVHEIWKKIEAGVEPDNVKTFCFTNAEFQSLNWIEDGEFVLDGNWYDVINIINNADGSYFLKVFQDDKEKDWMAKLFSKEEDQQQGTDRKFENNADKFQFTRETVNELRAIPQKKSFFIGESLILDHDYYSTLFQPPRLI